MSIPNSPSPSEGLYRASLSPKSDQYQLTPRSKVKALLAAIDDESSSDRETSPGKRKRNKVHDSSVTPNATRLRNVYNNDEESGEEEDSDEGPIISRRLAARLYRTEERISDFHASGEDNVYERIKHQLLPKAVNGDQAALPDLRSTSHSDREKSSSASQSSPRFDGSGSSTHSTPRSKKSAKSAAQVARMDSHVASHAETGDGSDSDLPAEPQNDDRLKSLVARKKQEAKARQLAKEQEAARRNERSHGLSGISEDSANDQVGEGKLTQQARPTRKASKKALEEMNRETQRMSRNMQLAHQAKTKKKITKESFFSRFNFKSQASATLNNVQGQSSSTVASSAPASDKEANSANESPPTSPLGADDIVHKLPATDIVHALPANEGRMSIEDVEAVLPGNLRLLHCLSPKTPEKVKNSKLNFSNEAQMQPRKLMDIKNTNVLARLHHSDHPLVREPDSESDLEILPRRKPKKSLKIFDRMPTKEFREDRSLQTLRALAHLNSPGKQTSSSRPVITMSEMQVSLQIKARKQAAEERAAKIQDLKDRGIIVQTAEERERDQAAIEDLVEKARQEAALIMKKEKDAARKAKLASGQVKSYDLSSDEDEEFEGDDEDESDVDKSGSGDDEGSRLNDDVELDEHDTRSSDEDEGEEREKPLNAEPNLNYVSAPQSSDNREEQEERDHSGRDEREQLESKQSIDPDTGYDNERRRRRTARIIEDDEDNDSMGEAGETPACFDPVVQKPFIPGLTFFNVPAMGMTQAFAATMADLPSQAEIMSTDPEQDSLALLGPMPEPNFPVYALDDSQTMVLDTQIDQRQSNGDATGPKDSSMEITLDFSQSQIGSLIEDSEDLPTATQFSEIPDPTQDVGFEKSSPIRNRFISVPPSTVDTVILSGIRNSPVVKKKGRLRRRISISMSNIEMNESATLANATTGSTTSVNAFDLLKNGAERSLKGADIFDKKQSEAKAMVEEQAQESEDEYAGLGGASDDESAGEEDEEVQKMIDEGEVDVDERELAAFYADKERAHDEKAVAKLFKDLNSGGLRRKRGAEFDLSDSDDDGEARRRAKRREFAKMRKALFENERIGKIAEDPKKLAFLRAIEDREHDENYYDLFDYEDPGSSLPTSAVTATNIDDNNTQDDDDRPNGNNPLPHAHAETNLTRPLQRPLQDSLPDKINRPPPPSSERRRSRAFQKPLSLADIRASVSFLLDDPDTINPLQKHHQLTTSSSPPPSDNDDDDVPAHRNNPFTTSASTTSNIIDRLSLKRAESASTSTSTSSSSRLAFFDRRTAAIGGTAASKVPALLRRATTSNLHFPNTKTGTGATPILAMTERTAGLPIGTAGIGTGSGKPNADPVSAVRMGGTRKSSVGYFARGRQREEDMKAKEKEKERRRREGMRKRAGGEGGASGGGGRLRALGTGTFE